MRRYFAPGPLGTPRAAAHGSLVQRLSLLWPVVLGGGHVELLMAAQGEGGGPAESPGLTSPVYFSTEEKRANGGSGAFTRCLTVNNAQNDCHK